MFLFKYNIFLLTYFWLAFKAKFPFFLYSMLYETVASLLTFFFSV